MGCQTIPVNEISKQEYIPDINFINMIIDLIMRLPTAKDSTQRMSIADTIIKKFYSKGINRDNEEEDLQMNGPSQRESRVTKYLDKGEISTSQKSTKERKSSKTKRDNRR